MKMQISASVLIQRHQRRLPPKGRTPSVGVDANDQNLLQTAPFYNASHYQTTVARLPIGVCPPQNAAQER
jgi:hypothetical protein